MASIRLYMNLTCLYITLQGNLFNVSWQFYEPKVLLMEQRAHGIMPWCIANVISPNSCSDIFPKNEWIICQCWSQSYLQQLVTEQYKASTSIKTWYSEYKPELPTLEQTLLLSLIPFAMSEGSTWPPLGSSLLDDDSSHKVQPQPQLRLPGQAAPQGMATQRFSSPC